MSDNEASTAEMEKVTISLPPPLLARIDIAAEAARRTRSNYIRVAMEGVFADESTTTNTSES